MLKQNDGAFYIVKLQCAILTFNSKQFWIITMNIKDNCKQHEIIHSIDTLNKRNTRGVNRMVRHDSISILIPSDSIFAYS